ncbi:hypothetical protein EJ06DRAFT_498555, partial [Trichodelitschia bisporula]
MSTAQVVLPGDPIDPSLLSTSTTDLKLGPGLRYTPPSSISASVAGLLSSDARKNAVWVEYAGGRYTPHVGDLVIATVVRGGGDFFTCAITPYAATAALPILAFEGANKKNRPQLQPGAVVYARVVSDGRHVEAELECVNQRTGKGDGLGPLKGGMVFDVSTAFARRLMMGKRGGVVVLEVMSEKVGFEVAVGGNGRVWV